MITSNRIDGYKNWTDSNLTEMRMVCSYMDILINIIEYRQWYEVKRVAAKYDSSENEKKT